MRIPLRRFTPKTLIRPSRHLVPRGATLASIEPLESRMLMSASPAGGHSFGGNHSGHSFTGSTVTTPAAPTALAATAKSTSEIDLSWAGDSSATGYYVQRSTDGKTFTQIADVSTATYDDTGLTADTVYTYRVVAYNTAGSSSASSTTTATTDAAATTTGSTTVILSSTQPSATNTGVTAGITLTTVSSFTATSNTTYKDLNITGQVTLTDLTNVKLVNCVIDANGAAYDVRCDGASGITIENCELRDAASAAVYGDGFTAIGNYVHESSGDGFKAGNNVVIEGNFVTQLGWDATDAHADGVQIRGGANIVISGNFFDIPNDVADTDSNSALFLQLAATNVTFEGNWVLGGNYAVHAYSDTTADNETIQITGNTFYSGSVRYAFGNVGTGVVWTNNVTDTGLVALASMS